MSDFRPVLRVALVGVEVWAGMVSAAFLKWLNGPPPQFRGVRVTVGRAPTRRENSMAREAVGTWTWDQNDSATVAVLNYKIDGAPQEEVRGAASALSLAVDHLPVGSVVSWGLKPFNGQEYGDEVSGSFTVEEPVGPVRPDPFQNVQTMIGGFHDSP